MADCANCGGQLAAGQFCPWCGGRISGTTGVKVEWARRAATVRAPAWVRLVAIPVVLVGAVVVVLVLR